MLPCNHSETLVLDWGWYKLYTLQNQSIKATFHAFIPIAWFADEDSLVCCIVMMGRQIAKMFYTFSL